MSHSSLLLSTVHGIKKEKRRSFQWTNEWMDRRMNEQMNYHFYSAILSKWSPSKMDIVEYNETKEGRHLGFSTNSENTIINCRSSGLISLSFLSVNILGWSPLPHWANEKQAWRGLEFPWPRARAPSGQLQAMLKHHHPATSTNDTKGGLSGHQNPAEISPALRGMPLHSWSSTMVQGWWSQLVLEAD